VWTGLLSLNMGEMSTSCERSYERLGSLNARNLLTEEILDFQ